MDQEQRAFLNLALTEYGASITEEGLFQKGNRVIPSVQIKIVKGRMRFENRMTGDVIMSGPISSRTVTGFVRKFWFWEKK